MSGTTRTAETDEGERLGVDELRAHQLRHLRSTLRHAYEQVPLYRAKFDAAGVHPDDLRELADLAEFPATTKEDLRAHYPFGAFAVPRERIARIHASSGTTGQPTVVGYTSADLETWAEVVARSIRAAGGRPGDLVHIAYGYGLFTGGLGAHYGAERLGCTVVPASGGMTARQAQLIRDFRPDLLMVTPSYALTLVDELRRQGVDPRETGLRAGIFGAEPWTEDMRRELEGALGIDAVDIYGLSEVMGPGVAAEFAGTKDGLHVWEDHFYPEVIDPVSGNAVPDGETGELVLTSLTKEAMPIIRYRTRDLTRLLPGTARPAMRRMERITGRSDDLLIVRGVNVFPTQIEELVLRADGLSPHFQIDLTRQERMDLMTIRVEASEATTAQQRRTAPGALVRAVKDAVGVTAEVEVVEPGALERSVGKLRRVLDRRGTAADGPAHGA
ncbi:phenylacetate--CoA ligase PaaK [Saccharopolyspora sp. MS10]|uniref:phenylacetate--CoA ligase PaaK n=1 Tax=Saccharopolyspora sp. MS10 TaxID=3385973 RepID=UPI0039A1531D